MTDLVARLREAIDETQQIAREAHGGTWEVGPTFGGRDNRVYVKPEGDGIDTLAGQPRAYERMGNMTEQRPRTATAVPPLTWTRVGNWEVRPTRGASMPVVVNEDGTLGLPCECCVEVRRPEAWRPGADRG